MSHRHVELIIGRLVSDEAFRQRFRRAAAHVLDELGASGIELTPAERTALVETPPDSWTRMAADLDRRLQKASLRSSDADQPSEPRDPR